VGVAKGGEQRTWARPALGGQVAQADADKLPALDKLDSRSAYVSEAFGEVWNEVWLPEARKWLPWNPVRVSKRARENARERRRGRGRAKVAGCICEVAGCISEVARCMSTPACHE